MVTRAGCDGDNSDAVRGRGGAILGASRESCVYIEQITRSPLYLDTRPHQDNAAINWSLGSCWPADNFIFIIVYEKFFWFSIVVKINSIEVSQLNVSQPVMIISNPLSMRRAYHVHCSRYSSASYCQSCICIKIFVS